MKVLVTGGLGVIGSLIARRLVQAGHAVTIIDAAEEPRNLWTRDQLRKDGIAAQTYLYRMERMTYDAWTYASQAVELREVVESVDAVIHAAAHTGIPHSMLDPADDWVSNVDATRALLEALRDYPRPTVVLSSIKPYWVPPRELMTHGLDENALLSADEPYAASKAAQSMLSQSYARSYDLPVVIFRCSNLYGPGAPHGPRHGWMTWMALSAAIGRPLVVQGDGTQQRDMLHADDVYTACMAAIENADRLKGEIYNLGGGRENLISVRQVVVTLHELTGVEIGSGPGRRFEDMLVYVTTEKFRAATGWVPRVGVRDGLREVLDWAAAHKADLRRLYEGV